jgi:hypothetical protein
MQNSYYISHPFVYSQSYLQDDEGNPVMYSESFTIGKISIEGIRKIQISNLKQFLGTAWKKSSSDVNVKIALILGDEIELDSYDSQLLINRYVDLLEVPVEPTDCLVTAGNTLEFPTRFIYNQIPISDVSEFSNLSSYYKLAIQNNYNFPLIREAPDVINNLIIENTKDNKYLYIITFCSQLTKTELWYSGNIQFKLSEEINQEDN